MRKIYIHGDDADLVYDVSSDDPDISRSASEKIQHDFSRASLDLHRLIMSQIRRKKSNKSNKCNAFK